VHTAGQVFTQQPDSAMNGRAKLTDKSTENDCADRYQTLTRDSLTTQ